MSEPPSVTSHQQIGAILLAAGASTRLGRSKQLLEVDGEPLVRGQARLLLSLQPAAVVVVTGACSDEVEAALQGLDVDQVFNPNWQDGMGSSLSCGIRAMPERVRGTLLLLCDQWKITGGDLHSLVDAWSKTPDAAVTASWQGDNGQLETGPPVVFPRALFERLTRLSGDRGAQQLLKRYRPGVQRVELPRAAYDIDTPADYRCYFTSTDRQEGS